MGIVGKAKRLLPSTRGAARRIALVLSALLIMGAGFATATVKAADNLLSNGDFEQSSNGMPAGWKTERWFADDGVTSFSVEQGDDYSGKQSAVIDNHSDNHARMLQTIKVNPNSIYRISGYIRTEGIDNSGEGAHLSVEGVAAYYPQVYDTQGQWAYSVFYGKTGKDQKEMTIAINVGGYGSLNAGKAWFDSIDVQQVSSAPEGAEIIPLSLSSVGNASTDEAPHKVSILTMLIMLSLFSLLYLIAHRFLFKDREWLQRDKVGAPLLLALAFLVALAIRLWLAMTHEGYKTDVNLFIYWSQRAVDGGLGKFYHSDFFVDYPPGYIYVLYALGMIKSWLGWGAQEGHTILLYKLPAIAADLIAAGVLFRAASKKLGAAIGIGAAALYLFNPAVILDSASWGQVDGVFALMLVLSIAALADRRIASASVWFAIAVLIKPQAFIFMPVLLLALLHLRSWRQVAVSAFYGFATFFLLALPFFWGTGGIGGLYDLYKGTLSSYPYASLNAFNLYALLGANWSANGTQWLFMSYQAWGYVFVAAAVVLAVLFSLIRGRNDKELAGGQGREDRFFFIAALLISFVFICVTKMHERYMFPVLLLSLFAFLQTADRRLLRVFYGFTITNFINMGYVLAFSEFTTDVKGDGVVFLCAIANIGLLLYLIYLGFDIYVRNRRESLPVLLPEDRRAEDERLLADCAARESLDERPRFNRLSRKEWSLLGAVILVYTVVAIYHLGSMKEPVTDWQPASSGDSFYVDLGEVKTLARITSYGGVGTGKFKYEFGLTPEQWTDPIEIDSNHVGVFSWNAQDVNVLARYVKLTVVQRGFSINELGIYESGAKTPLPIKAIVKDEKNEPTRGSVDKVFDEQDLMQYQQSYTHGSYFDEIYHARTAYENIEGIVAYENTHPPLGKLIIALGIKLFGLNPFGWRIAGTVFGIGMLPIMYMMARRMFGKPKYAFFATALLAVDFMHFTQTRIATIDVYGVFFIMLMFYFMHKYVWMSFYREKLTATLVPLGLAGLFFGLGAASKWIAIYGGAGLAVMLFWSLGNRYLEYRAAKRWLRLENEQKARMDEAALSRIVKTFPKNTFYTLAACLLFYIGIPGCIYALSYIPILSVMNGGYTWKALVDYQVHMYEYHANLVATHPFASSWWEWPFMKRPVWYYSGKELAASMKSTIVAMGNPLIWWTGIFTLLASLVISLKRKDKGIYMLWIAYFSQYIPWMLVPRETFLYHYFAMVPFMILSVVYIFKCLEERNPKFARLRYLYLSAATLLFVLFYPALSGFEVPARYVNIVLRWFPSWVF